MWSAPLRLCMSRVSRAGTRRGLHMRSARQQHFEPAAHFEPSKPSKHEQVAARSGTHCSRTEPSLTAGRVGARGAAEALVRSIGADLLGKLARAASGAGGRGACGRVATCAPPQGSQRGQEGFRPQHADVDASGACNHPWLDESSHSSAYSPAWHSAHALAPSSATVRFPAAQGVLTAWHSSAVVLSFAAFSVPRSHTARFAPASTWDT